MKKQLPPNFKSWIEFYDYMKCQYPDLDSKKTIRLIFRDIDNNKNIEYSIRMDTLERLCWREIQDLRMGEIQTYAVVHDLVFLGHNPPMTPTKYINETGKLLLALHTHDYK